MSDLTGKTITIPAQLNGVWEPDMLRAWLPRLHAARLAAGGLYPIATLVEWLVGEIERQCLPRMEEPVEFGAMVEAGTRGEGDSPRERRPLVCWNVVGVYHWTDDRGHVYRWSELIDPRPVGDESRAGATS
jgi:hypothetical protein